MNAPLEKPTWHRLALHLTLAASVLVGGCADPQGSEPNEGMTGAHASGSGQDKGNGFAQQPRRIESAAELRQLLGQEESSKVSKQATTCLHVAFRSKANNRYVSAEFGWGGDDFGMLRARATSVGPWERFWLCAADQSYTIRADVGHYVSAELGWGGDRYGMLRARAGMAGPWEVFDFWFSSPQENHWAISSKVGGRWVSAELGWGGDQYGMMRARGTDLGPWELFYIDLQP